MPCDLVERKSVQVCNGPTDAYVSLEREFERSLDRGEPTDDAVDAARAEEDGSIILPRCLSEDARDARGRDLGNCDPHLGLHDDSLLRACAPCDG